MNKKRFRIAVLISGGGTTLKNVLDHIRSGELDVEVGLVVSSTKTAKGIRFAEENEVPVAVLPKSRDGSDQQYSDDVFGVIRSAEIDLVVMGGFLKHVLIPDDFENRVINIHPSLIPAFCGAGFYGARVHQAVLDKGCKVSGCTVHYVDNEYDHGPIIEQVAVRVEDGDTADSLQERIFTAECDIYPRVIRQLSERNLS